MAEPDKKITETTDISARKKTLLLGRMLGLASEDDYRPSTASVAERAQHRQRKLLSAHQANLETIFALALNYTPSDVTGVDLDADWGYQFFQMAEQIHNPKMQDLWARILASEIVSPGNFSQRSLAVLKQFTFREAILLEKAAFEQYAHQHGVKNHNCHADNGILACNKLKLECINNGQGFSHATVNIHNKNSKAKKIYQIPIRTRKNKFNSRIRKNIAPSVLLLSGHMHFEKQMMP